MRSPAAPYDGRLTKADGKRTSWEGLDHQGPYAQNHAPGQKPDAASCTKFYNRTVDLINKYQPDLLYFDDDYTDTGLPLYDRAPRSACGSPPTSTTSTGACTAASWRRSSTPSG